MEGEAAHGKREESDGFAVPPSLSGSVFSIFWGVPKYGRHRSVETPLSFVTKVRRNNTAVGFFYKKFY